MPAAKDVADTRRKRANEAPGMAPEGAEPKTKPRLPEPPKRREAAQPVAHTEADAERRRLQRPRGSGFVDRAPAGPRTQVDELRGRRRLLDEPRLLHV